MDLKCTHLIELACDTEKAEGKNQSERKTHQKEKFTR